MILLIKIHISIIYHDFPDGMADDALNKDVALEDPNELYDGVKLKNLFNTCYLISLTQVTLSVSAIRKKLDQIDKASSTKFLDVLNCKTKNMEWLRQKLEDACYAQFMTSNIKTINDKNQTLDELKAEAKGLIDSKSLAGRPYYSRTMIQVNNARGNYELPSTKEGLINVIADVKSTDSNQYLRWLQSDPAEVMQILLDGR